MKRMHATLLAIVLAIALTPANGGSAELDPAAREWAVFMGAKKRPFAK